MRLRDEPQPTVSQPTSSRNSRKRKSPPDTNNQDPQIQQQIAQPPAIQHVLPSALMHTMSTVGFQYSPQDFTTGIPPGVTDQAESPPAEAQTGSGGRALSTSKRAEQNRKAQRAFRERRDQHVKHLESRSQLLDAALASADEANRRWEECRVLVDQLRVENAALRATLQQASLLPMNGHLVLPEEPKPSDGVDDKDVGK